MKNKSIWKVIAIMVALTFVLTWIVPSSTVGTSGVTVGSIMPTGFADIFTSLDVITYYFIKPSIFIIFVGMFYGVINKTGAYKALIDKVVSIIKSKKILFLLLTILFYALITALTGIYIPMFMFMPLSIAILIGLKYSKVQSILATVGASTIGLIGQISNSIINSIASIDTNSYIWLKVGVLIILVLLTILYIIKIKTSKDKSERTETTNDKIMFVPVKRKAEVDKKVSGISLFIVLIILLVVFILGLTPWSNAEIFDKAYTTIKNIKIGAFAPFSAILGTFETFGSWTYNSLYPTIALAIIVMSLANKLKFNEIIESCVEGAKKVLGLAVIAALISLVVIFTLNSGFMATIINILAKSGNIALITLSSLISSPFMMELSYAAQYNLSIIYSSIGSESVTEIWCLIVQITYGFVMLVAPSSVLLMVGLGYVEEDYCKWIKYIWKLLLAIFIICLIAILIASVL